MVRNSYELNSSVKNYSSNKDILLWSIIFITSLLIAIGGLLPSDKLVFLLGDSLDVISPTSINVAKFVSVFVSSLLCIYSATKFIKVNSNLDALISSDKVDNISTLIKEDTQFLDHIKPLLINRKSCESITNRDYYYYNVDIFFEDHIQQKMKNEIQNILKQKSIESNAIYIAYNSRIKYGYEDLKEPLEASKEVLKRGCENRPNFDNKGVKYVFESLVRAISISIGYFVYLISLLVTALITNGVGPYYRPPILLRGGVDRVGLVDHSRFLEVSKYDPLVFNYLQQVQNQGRILVDTDLSKVNLNKREALLKTAIIEVELNGSKAVPI